MVRHSLTQQQVSHIMLALGATNYDREMNLAADGDHQEIVGLLSTYL